MNNKKKQLVTVVNNHEYESRGEGLFSFEDAMKYLGIKSRSTMYKLIKDGNIPYINMNPRGKYVARRFSKEVLDEFLDRKGVRVDKEKRTSGRHGAMDKYLGD